VRTSPVARSPDCIQLKKRIFWQEFVARILDRHRGLVTKFPGAWRPSSMTYQTLGGFTKRLKNQEGREVQMMRARRHESERSSVRST
jgi:hypothetical protein